MTEASPDPWPDWDHRPAVEAAARTAAPIFHDNQWIWSTAAGDDQIPTEAEIGTLLHRYVEEATRQIRDQIAATPDEPAYYRIRSGRLSVSASKHPAETLPELHIALTLASTWPGDDDPG